MLELIKEGHGSRMVAELRQLEDRQRQLEEEIGAAGTPEPIPALHPNLPELYRRKSKRSSNHSATRPHRPRRRKHCAC